MVEILHPDGTSPRHIVQVDPGASLVILVPGASGLLLGAAASLTAALGVPREAIGAGWDAFHFWR